MPKILNLMAEISSPSIDSLRWRVPEAAMPPGHRYSAVVFAYAHAVLAAVLRRIDAVAPEAARRLHDADGNVRQWSLSPLCRGGDGWGVQLAIPCDPLADIVLRALQEAGQPVVLQHPALPATIRFTGASIAAETSWEQLMATATGEKWRLFFLTPTAMAMPGGRSKLQLPLPLPAALLESWRRVWNQHCPTEHLITDEDGAMLADHLALSTFIGETALVEIAVKGYMKQFVGFSGQATFSLLDARNLPPRLLTACRALFRFAPYSGSGKKTAWGMGITRPAEGH